jgi:peptide/nickel transport system substrate-binding protein
MEGVAMSGLVTGMLRGRRRARGMAHAAVVVVLAGVLAACGGGSGSGSGGSGASGMVTAALGNSSPFVANFNPFSPSVEDPAFGMIYEPLMFFDTARAGNVQPWLATGYTWGDGGKSITFKLRSGVKWSDGQPVTSADVAYTFNLIKSSAALNQYGLPIASATASGADSVTITFTQPVYTDLYYIAGAEAILPQHVWSKIKNPSTWTDPKPVATGAYEVTKVTPQVMELTANPHYYMPGRPEVKTYEFLTYSSNTTSDTAIEQGQLGWASAFIPNINKTYLARNPKFALIDIPLAVGFLIPNMAKGPTTSLAVRQAISAAIDRSYISQSVYNGYAPPTNPAALLLPNYQNVAAPASAGKFPGADPAKAKQILQSAGVKLPLSLTVKTVSGYTDYASILQILQPELKAAGINLQVSSEAFSVWTSDQDTGNFQLLLSDAGYTPDPYAYYYNLLSSGVTAPLGTSESIGNFGRYKNPQVDQDLATIASTTDLAKQKPAFADIESIFAAQIPDIPLFEQQDEIEFNGSQVSGYPTTGDSYAGPPSWLKWDSGWVADHLAPAK